MSKPAQGHWLLGHVLPLWRDPLQTFSDVYREGGPVGRLRLGWTTLYLVAHPDHVQHVLQTNNRNYVLNRQVMPLARAIMGTNLVTSDGEFWIKHRRIMQPVFAADHMSQLVEPVVQATSAMLQRWESVREDGPLDLAQELRTLSLRIGALTLIGSTLTPQEEQLLTEGITAGMEYFAYRTRSPWALPLAAPSPYNRRVKSIRRQVYDLIDGMVERRRRQPSPSDNLLQRLIDAKDPKSGESLTNEEIRFEAIGVLTAASETTANALSWTIYLLCQHPAATERITAEIAHSLESRIASGADVASLVYARRALEEAMRLYPPTWVMGRTALESDQLGDVRVPAGSHLAISPYVTHRLPEFWDHPELFRPERFAEDQITVRHPFAYYPFGAGPRACIGRYFAMLEMPLILAMILQAFEFELAEGHTVKTEPQISLRPRHGILAHVRPRSTRLQSAHKN